MGRADLENRIPGNRSGGDEQGRSRKHAGQRFVFSMPVGVVRIRGTKREMKTRPGDQRRKDVARRFDAVGDQRIRISNDADGDFHGHENDIHAEREQSQAKGFSGVDHGSKVRLHLLFGSLDWKARFFLWQAYRPRCAQPWKPM